MRRIDREDGFSLIELLTVVVILGLLASIAIVGHLNQRERAWEAAARSDLHAMHTAQYALEASYGSYAADLDVLVAEGFRETAPAEYEHGVCLFEWSGREQFLVAARHTSSPSTWVWDTVGSDYVEVPDPDLVAVMAARGDGCGLGSQAR